MKYRLSFMGDMVLGCVPDRPEERDRPTMGPALPFIGTASMQLHIEEISGCVARGAHAVLLLDRAGWHTTDKLKLPRNISLIFLPSRAPELNPVENIRQFLRANWLFNTIIEASCSAWNTLAALPETIRSIGLRKWAHTGQCL